MGWGKSAFGCLLYMQHLLMFLFFTLWCCFCSEIDILVLEFHECNLSSNSYLFRMLLLTSTFPCSCVLLYTSFLSLCSESILGKMCWRKKAYIVRREQRMSNAVQKNGAWGLLVMPWLEQEVEPDWKT